LTLLSLSKHNVHLNLTSAGLDVLNQLVVCYIWSSWGKHGNVISCIIFI